MTDIEKEKMRVADYLADLNEMAAIGSRIMARAREHGDRVEWETFNFGCEIGFGVDCGEHRVARKVFIAIGRGERK